MLTWIISTENRLHRPYRVLYSGKALFFVVTQHILLKDSTQDLGSGRRERRKRGRRRRKRWRRRRSRRRRRRNDLGVSKIFSPLVPLPKISPSWFPPRFQNNSCLTSHLLSWCVCVNIFSLSFAPFPLFCNYKWKDMIRSYGNCFCGLLALLFDE